MYIRIKLKTHVLTGKHYLAKFSEIDSDSRDYENIGNGTKGNKKPKHTNELIQGWAVESFSQVEQTSAYTANPI